MRKLLRRFAIYVLRNIHPSKDEIDTAIYDACTKAGLNVRNLHGQFDLLHSGKLHVVLVHSLQNLGQRLVTIDDLKKLLK
jgi:hypothetical protein